MIYNNLNHFEETLCNLDCSYSFFLKRITLKDIEKIDRMDENKIIVLDDESYPDLLLILERNNNKNKILIEIEDKEKFNNFILKNSITNNNIYIQSKEEILELKEYLKLEKFLYMILKPAQNFSPFEKFIYAYNIVKNFKAYKEDTNNSINSRGLYNILENDYIVCVGFSNLFGALLDKLGVNNISLFDDVDASYDDEKDFSKFVPKTKITNKCGHVRKYVYLKDEKYKIDGFYISDPTWDNNLTKDYYNHLLMTDSEITSLRRYSWIDFGDINELFNIQNLEEFHEKIDFFVKRSIFFFNRKCVIIRLINRIKKLDLDFYKNLKLKYNFIDNLYKYSGNINDLIDDIGKYILSRVNKNISITTMFQAIKEVYKEFYGYDDNLEQTINDVYEENKKRQLVCFPKRYKYFKNNRIENYDNNKNKFDVK